MMKLVSEEDRTLDRRHFTTTAGLAGLVWATRAGAQGLSPSPVPPQPVADPTATLLKPSQWKLLQETLDQAPSHGLRAEDFAQPGMAGMLQSPDAGVRAQGGRLLIAAALKYARAVKTGRLPLASFPYEWGLRPSPYDPGPEFMRAVADDRLAAWLDSLPPPYAGYQGLRRALADWRKAVSGDEAPPLAAGAKLSADTPADQRIPVLRRRLAALGYAIDPAAAGWDEALTQAVAQFQKRHGLEADGVVASATIEALNVPARIRERQMVANLERWRWLPTTLPVDRIQVNIVAGILTLFEHDAPVLSMKAVAGKIGDETPMLQSKVHSVVLNPPWNVPSSIATKELWPKERADPGYLARNDYVIIKTEGAPRIQQRAGPKSALGQVKFDFQNPYGVYLHDTPSRGGFSRVERLASHGCVRLEKPIELAKTLLRGDGRWTPEAIDETVAGNTTTRVPLASPIAVFLLYWTAYSGADGQVNFRADRYGWDELLLKLIERDAGVRA